MSYQKHSKKQSKTFLEIALVGIMRALWFLIKLPFKGMAKKKGISVAERNEITLRRHKIESLLNSNSEIELKHAVLEADKLVDHILKLKGYEGDTFADKLRSAEESMSHLTYNEIWQGHKIRNRIAHENELRITNQELRTAADKLLKFTKSI
ncbi:MAG: hypothetical protein WC536_02830 [Patescibacteria group bacterium]